MTSWIDTAPRDDCESTTEPEAAGSGLAGRGPTIWRTKGIPETFIDLNFDPQIRPRTQIKEVDASRA